MIDVAIIGGGPTGLGAALYAARAGLRPVVIEPRAGIIDKACGEGLMPGAIAELAALGVDPAGHPFRGICYRDHRIASRSAVGDFRSGPGRGVRRLVLHAALSDAVEAAGIERITAKVEHVEQNADRVRLAGIEARWALAADGLHSPTRRALELDRPTRGGRFGVRQHFAVTPWSDRVEVHWARGVEAYVTPIAPDEVGVAFLTRPPTRFTALLADFPLLRDALGDASPRSKPRGAGPFPVRAKRVRHGRVLLVGDAAGYVDALTGEGIALGLSTARAAIDCIAHDQPARYPRAWRRATRRYVWLTRGLLWMTRPRWVHRPLIGLLRACPPIFDTAVSLLAGRAAADP